MLEATIIAKPTNEKLWFSSFDELSKLPADDTNTAPPCGFTSQQKYTSRNIWKQFAEQKHFYLKLLKKNVKTCY